MSFKLSSPIEQGLQNLGTIIPLDVSKKIIAKSVKMTLHPSEVTTVPEIYATHADKAKQSEYAIVALLALATKHLTDAKQLGDLLKKHEVNAAINEELCRLYEEHSKDLIVRQLRLGYNHPHITEVQWRIFCDVKSTSTNQSSGEVNFHINLGRYQLEGGARETITEFELNQEELQSFINKLKEIERHCEKFATE